MSGYQNTGNTGAPGQHVGIGTKIKDAVTPGTHNTGEYVGQGGQGGGLGGGRTGANSTTTGNTGAGFGGQPNVGNTGYNQGATTGGGGIGGGGGLTSHNQSGQTGGGIGSGIGGSHNPQEQFEKKTHNTHDHDENESYETSTKRL